MEVDRRTTTVVDTPAAEAAAADTIATRRFSELGLIRGFEFLIVVDPALGCALRLKESMLDPATSSCNYRQCPTLSIF